MTARMLHAMLFSFVTFTFVFATLLWHRIGWSACLTADAIRPSADSLGGRHVSSAAVPDAHAEYNRLPIVGHVIIGTSCHTRARCCASACAAT